MSKYFQELLLCMSPKHATPHGSTKQNKIIAKTTQISLSNLNNSFYYRKKSGCRGNGR